MEPLLATVFRNAVSTDFSKVISFSKLKKIAGIVWIHAMGISDIAGAVQSWAQNMEQLQKQFEAVKKQKR